jgi:microsomal epoxide hydrolase
VNLGFIDQPEGVDESKYTPKEREGIKRGQDFARFGSAYALLHATCPSTSRLSLSASPPSLLPYLAEKFIAWSDPASTPSLEFILEETTLYFLTNTFPTSIYPYRQLFMPGIVDAYVNPKWIIPDRKKFGFSRFPKETAPVPRAWVEKTERVDWWQEHDLGGHFCCA